MNIRFLLIDDNDIDNFIHTQVIKNLKPDGDIRAFTSARSALDYMKLVMVETDTRYIILLDINMPQMNGFDFLEAYEKLDFGRKASVDIYMLTSSTYLNDIELARNNGLCKAYITKPLTAGAIAALVNHEIYPDKEKIIFQLE